MVESYLNAIYSSVEPDIEPFAVYAVSVSVGGDIVVVVVVSPSPPIITLPSVYLILLSVSTFHTLETVPPPEPPLPNTLSLIFNLLETESKCLFTFLCVHVV